jgi:hypothetical protein
MNNLRHTRAPQLHFAGGSFAQPHLPDLSYACLESEAAPNRVYVD